MMPKPIRKEFNWKPGILSSLILSYWVMQYIMIVSTAEKSEKTEIMLIQAMIDTRVMKIPGRTKHATTTVHL